MEMNDAEMNKMMVRCFGHIRRAMDRLQKRISAGICTSDTDGFSESMHDMVDFMLIRMTMETFMREMEGALAEKKLKDPEARKELEFGDDTEDDEDSKEFMDLMNQILNEGKDEE